MRIVIAIAGVLLFAPLAFAGEESHVYDAQGRYQGRATTDTANPQQKSLYDAQGRYVGREMASPNGETRVYDQQGRYMGRTAGQTPNVKR